MTDEHLTTAGGLQTRFVEEGEGSPVVMLHGFSGSADSMAGLAKRLARHHRVIRIDLVGHGLSQKPADPEAYTMDAAVRQVLDVIQQRCDEPVALIGYSMGARVALAAALTAPELFRAVVLISGTAGIADPARRAARQTADEALADRIEAEGIEWFADHWMSQPFFETQRRLGPEHVAEARRQRLDNDPKALANVLRGMGTGAQPSYWHLLSRLEVPLLFITGEEDRKFSEIGEQIVAAVPQGMLVVVPDAGHATHLEAAGDVTEVVEHFISTRRGRLFD